MNLDISSELVLKDIRQDLKKLQEELSQITNMHFGVSEESQREDENACWYLKGQIEALQRMEQRILWK